jgi:hypothetical protein
MANSQCLRNATRELLANSAARRGEASAGGAARDPGGGDMDSS